MNRLKKRLAFLLAAVLLFALVAPAAPEVTAFAATKNPITKLGIEKLPEGSTIQVGDVFNFNPDIIETELGKGKTTGKVWWEVNTKTNTAGVSSSRWGYVYPLYEGSFEIRALAFANTQDMEAWKAAKSANGKVADGAATAKYVTAMTDWVTIDVVSDTEGYAVARTQYQLGLVLKNTKATDVHIKTDNEVSFKIAAKNYTRRTLTIDAPNAEVENAGRFAQINIQRIKASTFTEKAYGNRFYVTAPDARIVFLNNARTSEIVFEPQKTAESKQLTLVGEGGTLSMLNIKAAGKVDIVGDIFANRIGKAVVVNVAEEAAGTSIQTATALEVNAAADVAVTVNQAEGSEAAQDAPKTVINMEKAAKVSVDGTAADGTTVVVKGEAKGSEIASDAALVIVADADVSLNLSGSAAGTTVKKGENVKIELSVESTVDGVSVTDVNGTVETIKPGEDSPEVTAAPSATPTPVPTTAPSGGSSSGGSTPSYPVTPSTPTPVPTTSASYSLDGKSTGVSFGAGSKEAVVALPANSSAKTVTLTVNGNNTQKVLAVGVNAVRVGDYVVKFIVPLESVKISASLSDVKVSTTSGAAVTGTAVLEVKVEDDLSAFTADSDFNVSYLLKDGSGATKELSQPIYQKEVEVLIKNGIASYSEAGQYSVTVSLNHKTLAYRVSIPSNALAVNVTEKLEGNSVSWIPAEYSIPDNVLFNVYFELCPVDGMTESDWLFKEGGLTDSPAYALPLGVTVKSDCKYIFAYDKKFYATYRKERYDEGNDAYTYSLDVEREADSIDFAPVQYKTMEDALSISPVADAGIDTYLLLDATGKCTTMVEVRDLLDVTYIIIQEASGYIYYESLTDLFDHNLHSVYVPEPDPDPIDYDACVTVTKVEGKLNTFTISWDFPDKNQGFSITIGDNEMVYWLDRVSEYYPYDVPMNKGSITVTCDLEPGVYNWSFDRGFGRVKGSIEITDAN